MVDGGGGEGGGGGLGGPVPPPRPSVLVFSTSRGTYEHSILTVSVTVLQFKIGSSSFLQSWGHKLITALRHKYSNTW